MAQESPPSYHPNIRADRDGFVVTVTIDRPESKNACTGDMWVALGRTFRDVAFSGARAVILTGAGGDFCTGADLGGAPGVSPSNGNGNGSGTRSGAPPHNLDNMRVLADVVLAVHDCPVPVVAKVDGLCVGAGLGLALAADLTWCARTARFSLIFARRGLSLDFGTSWLLRQRIGVHRAKELAYTARMLSGTEAAEIGFVNAVVPAEGLDAAVREIADSIAAGPPVALSMTKRALAAAGTSSLAQALEVEALAQTVNVHTRDMREALAAYVERRPPLFEGR
ncbi:enoyl-CoA hydratase [Parafrankia colletiae]|uniref:Enoyl-CoA hydratase n=1 Tax=Parafrankia colletiae TaxID=573497 RepID=A0A1S1R3D0_9ACTN|nr:enoyl-CoA hydratase-related protein [Parafrankia colletiae]MCK9900237.1 enoyl-CoA hydratase-related protein [Frankia sp. Cpl3]OHV40279.1 enoyl-CoA hydratase [Parafrankia colletiae]